MCTVGNEKTIGLILLLTILNGIAPVTTVVTLDLVLSGTKRARDTPEEQGGTGLGEVCHGIIGGGPKTTRTQVLEDTVSSSLR